MWRKDGKRRRKVEKYLKFEILEKTMEEGQVEVTIKAPSRHPRREDVIGKAGDFLEEFIQSQEEKGLYDVMGVDRESTFLLHGKPGLGKSLTINAINNEMNKDFYRRSKYRESKNAEEMDELGPEDLELITLEYNIGEYGTAYINRGSRKIQSFFDQAFFYSQFADTLIVMDECDALLQSRTGTSRTHGEDKKNLETIMKNLQVAHDTRGVNVILSTNLREGCDDASLRSGRIDQKVKFELPDYDERHTAYEFEVDRANRRADYTVVRGIDYDEVSRASQGFNYADINVSVERAIRSRIKDLRDESGVVNAPYCSHERLMNQINIMQEESGKQETIGFA